MRERRHGDGKHRGNRKLLLSSGPLILLLKEGEATHRDLVRRKREKNCLQPFGEDVRASVSRAHASNEFHDVSHARDVEKRGESRGRWRGGECVNDHGERGAAYHDPCEHSLTVPASELYSRRPTWYRLVMVANIAT